MIKIPFSWLLEVMMKNKQKINNLFLSFLLIIPLAIAGAANAQSELSLEFTYSDSVTTNEITEIIARLTDSEGKPVADKLITFSTDSGSLDTKSAVTNENGEASIYFTAPDELGTSQVTAKVDGVTETIEIKTEMSILQWIFYMVVCLLSIFGVGGGTALYLRKARKVSQEK